MYEILLEKQAEKDLKNLPTQIFDRVIPAIKDLSVNPRPSGCLKLKNSLQDYRILTEDAHFNQVGLGFQLEPNSF